MAPRTPKNPDSKPSKPAAKARPAPVAKPAAKTKPASAAKSPKPALKVVDAGAGSGVGAQVKVKQLVEGVAAASGLKKPEARKAVDATLSAIGAALASGSVLVLPPLGKLRVVKSVAGAMTLKLRTGAGGTGAGGSGAGGTGAGGSGAGGTGAGGTGAGGTDGKPAAKPLADDGEDD